MGGIDVRVLKWEREPVHDTLTESDTNAAGCEDVSRALYRIDPLTDDRWNELLKSHPRASVFHSIPWLKALQKTYGYQPIAYTTSPPETKLQNGIVFCRIDSWLTGSRLVSLPFSDSCDPLINDQEDPKIFFNALEQEVQYQNWRYIEIRPAKSLELAKTSYRAISSYVHFQIDLKPDIESLFRNLHKGSIQRKIRRAARDGIRYQEGSTESLLDFFYPLLVSTRRRHHVPPQPKKWFRNLMNCFGEALKIRIAFKGDRPIAGMLTIRYKDALTYKYGASDARFNKFGGVHLLYWEAIREAKNSGLRTFDLGRTDLDQPGLILFKNRWGADPSILTYSRCSIAGKSEHIFDPRSTDWKAKTAKLLFGHAPTGFLSVLGNLLYKHIG